MILISRHVSMLPYTSLLCWKLDLFEFHLKCFWSKLTIEFHILIKLDMSNYKISGFTTELPEKLFFTCQLQPTLLQRKVSIMLTYNKSQIKLKQLFNKLRKVSV